MKIPIQRTPRTSPTAQTREYVKAPPPTDYTPITGVLNQFAAQIDARKKEADQTDLQRQLIDETNALQQDFEERKNNTTLEQSYGFTQRTLSDYEERHKALVDQMWKAGYGQEQVRDFDTRLAKLRQGFGEQALVYQGQQMVAAAKQAGEKLTTSASQYVANNPLEGYDSGKQIITEHWDRVTGLTAAEREAGKNQDLRIYRKAAQDAFALKYPQLTIDKLDPHGITEPKASTAGAYDVLSGYQGVAQGVANELGLKPEEVAAVMSFETGGTFDPKIMGGAGGKYMGLVQFGPNEQQLYGITADSTPQQWTQAILGFMRDRGFKKGMGIEDFYSTILAGRPGRHDAQDANGTSVRNAMSRILGEHQAKAQEWLRQGQPAQPDYGNRADGTKKGNGWLGPIQRPDGNVSTEISVGVTLGGQEREIPLMVPGLTQDELNYLITNKPDDPAFLKNLPRSIMDKAVAHAQKEIDAGRSPFKQDGPPPESSSFNVADITTGIPTLDEADGNERLAMLAAARSETKQQTSQLRGALEVRLQNGISAFMTTGEDGGPPITKDQVISVFGGVEGEQKWAQYEGAQRAGQTIQRIRTLTPGQIEAQVQALKPKPGSATYAQDQKAFAAAAEARDAVLKARQDDPANYVLTVFPKIAAAVNNAKTPDQRREAYHQMHEAMNQLDIPLDQRQLLTKGQVDQLEHQYEMAAPAQKLGMIEDMLNTMGGTYAGHALGRATDGKAAADFALYGLMQGRPDWQRRMLEIFRGREAIEKDPAQRPSQAVITQRYAGTQGLGPALRNLPPELSSLINKAASELYVARGGRTQNGALSNNQLYDQALMEVLGDSGAADVNSGGKVPDLTILPPGISKKQFSDWQDTLTNRDFGGNQPRMVTRQGYTPMNARDIAEDGVFVMVAPGVYSIKMKSDGRFAVDGTGNVWKARITPGVIRRGR